MRLAENLKNAMDTIEEIKAKSLQEKIDKYEKILREEITLGAIQPDLDELRGKYKAQPHFCD